jgi:glycosyltransferase involved in cell wall biosynthesis
MSGSRETLFPPSGFPKQGMLFEPYLEKHQLLEGNTRKIIRVFRWVNRDLYRLLLVSPGETDFFDHIKELQGECVHLPAPSILLSFGGAILKQNLWGCLKVLLSLIYYNLKICHFLRRRRIDFVQCHSLRALLTAGLGAKLAGRPVMWWVKSQLGNPFLDRLAFRLADRIVFQNRANRDRLYPHLVRRYADKIRILREGIDLQEVEQGAREVTPALKQELKWRPDRLNLIMLARLTPRKGVHVLLEAMVRVQQALPQVALYLVGDDATPEHLNYMAGLKEFMTRHQLRNIFFTGWRADRLSILALMDVLVVASSDEGLPTAILEAMALAKPVIATRAGGIPELVRDGENGILVEIGEAQGLAQAIITLAHDPQLRRRLGARGRQTVVNDYSLEAQIANLEAIYRELTSLGQALGKPMGPQPLLHPAIAPQGAIFTKEKMNLTSSD